MFPSVLLTHLKVELPFLSFMLIFPLGRQRSWSQVPPNAGFAIRAATVHALLVPVPHSVPSVTSILYCYWYQLTMGDYVRL